MEFNMKVVISHIKNEEYLLPWWLNHHKNKFDHGVIIDYHSTDKSRDIIKEICPGWEIVTSTQTQFGAAEVDIQVANIEKEILNQHKGAWVIALNVTEFLIGDTSVLDSFENNTALFVPCNHMIDSQTMEGVSANPDIPLHEQRTHGILYKTWRHGLDDIHYRGCRVFHNFPIDYCVGRHYHPNDHFDKLSILHYAFSPYTPQLIERKLQIQHNIPQSDKDIGWGGHHLCDETELKRRLKHYQSLATDIKDYIKRYEP
jgi:hypothetical protein